MVRARTAAWGRLVLEQIERSFSETHTPHQIAGSFALGVFLTMLPTLGTGLVLFVVLAYLFDWINRVALFASVLVFNPVVKWGVYAASVTLGYLILGPVDGTVATEFSLDAGEEILLRLLLGNLILAVIGTAVAYLAVYHLARRYQDEAAAVVEVVIEEVEEELFDEGSTDVPPSD